MKKTTIQKLKKIDEKAEAIALGGAYVISRDNEDIVSLMGYSAFSRAVKREEIAAVRHFFAQAAINANGQGEPLGITLVRASRWGFKVVDLSEGKTLRQVFPSLKAAERADVQQALTAQGLQFKKNKIAGFIEPRAH